MSDFVLIENRLINKTQVELIFKGGVKVVLALNGTATIIESGDESPDLVQNSIGYSFPGEEEAVGWIEANFPDFIHTESCYVNREKIVSCFIDEETPLPTVVLMLESPTKLLKEVKEDKIYYYFIPSVIVVDEFNNKQEAIDYLKYVILEEKVETDKVLN